ncbi:Gfo/Idh/MocA family protein [Streptomyces sp. NPDC006739]|uniref:Gfo/Idh/MocA family protein n=1 Tax=Streptomyces sp. NPDC006739 TaxID=3364763 RepID=UPI0036B23776
MAVCDLDEDRLADAPARVPRHRDHRELLRAAGLDAVVVNVPNDLHHPVCRDALAAGRAVCVEKPLATNPDDGHDLVRLSRRSGAVLFTSFHRRYNREVGALRARVVAACAPITSLTVRYEETIEEHAGRDRWYLDPERCGGGCVADNGPNAFDLVRLFLRDVQLTEATVQRDARGVDRRAQVLLRAPSGALARVELDWSRPGERKTVEVRLADGTVDRADMLAGHPEFKASLWHEYAGVLRDFTDVLAGRRANAPNAADGLAALELVAAVYAHERGGGTGPRPGQEVSPA